MSSLSFHELSVANRTRCETSWHPIAEWSPTDWACAMAGECGEACNLVKKLRRATTTAIQTQGALRKALLDGSLDREQHVASIAAELADMVLYADLLAQRLGIDLGAAVAVKFNHVSQQIDSQEHLPVCGPVVSPACGLAWHEDPVK